MRKRGARFGTCLDRIAVLYQIEGTIRGRPPDQRLAVRTEHTAPLMTELRDWLDATLSAGGADTAILIPVTNLLKRPASCG